MMTISTKKSRGVEKTSRSWSLNTRGLVLPSAVLIWYILGVLSISTTKILLTNYETIGITPSILTLQQLFIGMIVLRLWIWKTKSDTTSYPIIHFKKIISIAYNGNKKDNINNDTFGYFELFSSGIFFTLGFLFTNLSFSAADASFVETIKASEPISSASLSVLWKLETMSLEESYSLLGICVGVIMSTVGNANGGAKINESIVGGSALMQSLRSSVIVMGSNICFSFRGLYQKLFRASPIGRPHVVNDIYMQYLIHKIGVVVMVVLVVWLDFSSLIPMWYESIMVGGILSSSQQMVSFLLLSLVNGLAFTHYNLASSYILSRISVVTHAALNCIRRLFAIVVTSIIFSVPITTMSGLGISVSIFSFLLYTRFKSEKKSMLHPHKPSSILPP